MSKKTKQPFKVSRLQFTEEERADPALEKPIVKSEKAAEKLEKAGAKTPKGQSRPKNAPLMPKQASSCFSLKLIYHRPHCHRPDLIANFSA